MLASGSLLSIFAIASWLIARFPDSLGLRIMAGVGATLVVVVLIATLVLPVVLLAAHSALHWPVRKYALLLAATYTAGSGAPYWTGRQVPGAPDDGVIRLPIPPQLGTTSFAIDEETRQAVVTEAYQATSSRLTQIFGSRAASDGTSSVAPHPDPPA